MNTSTQNQYKVFFFEKGALFYLMFRKNGVHDEQNVDVRDKQNVDIAKKG